MRSAAPAAPTRRKCAPRCRPRAATRACSAASSRATASPTAAASASTPKAWWFACTRATARAASCTWELNKAAARPRNGFEPPGFFCARRGKLRGMNGTAVGTRKSVRLSATPETIELPIPDSALIVVDMQNGYASRGGYRDLAGKDVGPAQRVVENTKRLLDAGRRAGLTVVYLQNGWDADLKSSGGRSSPNWHKSNPLTLRLARPELRG